MIPDVNVYVLDFPNTEKEMVMPQEDGNFTIYINAKLSEEQQLRSYKHALKHIENYDFEKADVQKIESEAHEIIEHNKPARPEWVEKRLKRLAKERQKIQKELREYEEDRDRFFDFRESFIIAENQHLYGHDL